MSNATTQYKDFGVSTLTKSSPVFSLQLFLFSEGKNLKVDTDNKISFPKLLESDLANFDLVQLASIEFNISKLLDLYEQVKEDMEEAGSDIKSDNSYYVEDNYVSDIVLTDSYDTVLDNISELNRLQLAINNIL